MQSQKEPLLWKTRLNKAFYLLALNQIRGGNNTLGVLRLSRYYKKKLAEGKTSLSDEAIGSYQLYYDAWLCVYQEPQPRACSQTSEEVALPR